MTLDATAVTDEFWSPPLAGIKAEALDCMQTNLAVIADSHHPGAHLALGAPLRFTLASQPGDRVPAIAAALDDRLAQATELLGLRVAARWDGMDGAGLRDLAANHSPMYVVADAFSMAWVPYHGQRHLDHSFLLVEAGPRRTLIVDAYHNTTEWGETRPGVWRISAAELDAAAGGATAITFDVGSPPRLDAEAILAGNSAAMQAASADIERYAAAARTALGDRDALERLVLDVWLLSRSRQLHAAWLASLDGWPDEAAAASEHAQAWQRTSTLAFVAERRARRGQPVSPAVVDQLTGLLREDVLLARRLAPTLRTDEPRAVVLDELAAITGLDGGSLNAETELRSLPGFSSFRLVDLIERAEKKLGVQLDPDDLTADSLRTVSSLCDLFAGAADRRRGPHP